MNEFSLSVASPTLFFVVGINPCLIFFTHVHNGSHKNFGLEFKQEIE